METKMKLKNIINTLLITATVGASGSASAASFPWSWSGSLQNFSNLGSVVDRNPPTPVLGTSSPSGTGDGDTTFTFESSNNLDILNTTIGLTEQLVPGYDLYNVGVGFVTGQTTGSFAYTISTTNVAGLNAAGLDSLVTIGGNGGEVREDIYSGSNHSNLLLTLDSINSAVIPATGLNSFNGQQSLYIVDTIIGNGGIQDFHNNLSAVPEAEEWAMMLLGLPLLAWMSRRKQAVNLVA